MSEQGTVFGREVRKRRLERDVGLRELASLLEVTPAYLSDIEKGARVPIDEKVQRLATLLGVDPARWSALAANERRSVALPLARIAEHSKRDAAAVALFRKWANVSEDTAEKIRNLLENGDA